jgi:23S rRNA pseudouridine1911/1915/1917 synthase
MEILYEDNHCLAVFKRAGIPVQATEPGGDSLQSEVQRWLKARDGKPGNVFVGIVHRLDVGTRGIVLFAKTSKGASRLSESFRGRDVEKHYLALVHGRPPGGPVTLESIVDEKPASLTFRARSPGLLDVELHTGRKHQIRVQLADAGYPIVGDVQYGGPPSREPGFALLAWRLAFPHPIRRDDRVVVALRDAEARLAPFREGA